MSPTGHVIASGVVSVPFYFFTQSWIAALACFLSGILIDLDHYIDFWIHHKKISFSYRKLYSYCIQVYESKIYLFLHSYEGIIIFWGIIYYYHLNIIWIGIALGLSSHLLFDQVTNPFRRWGYFFIYRIKSKFSKKFLVTDRFYSRATAFRLKQ